MRFLATPIPPPPVALVAKDTVHPPEGPRYLPKPIKLCGTGKSTANWVADSRR